MADKDIQQAQWRALYAAAAFASDGRNEPMDPETLSECLLADEPDKQWTRHMRRLLGAEEANLLQDLVRAGCCDFRDLERAAKVWSAKLGLLDPWIRTLAAQERQVVSEGKDIEP